jgi:LEA14-like dessication related protein
MKWFLPLSFPIVIGIYSCGKIKDPEFRRVENFGVKSFGIEKIELGFKVTYYNPNNFGVNVKEAVADFYVDSVYMGKFVQDQVIEVNKNAEFSIPLSGSVPLATALKLKVNDLSNRSLLIQANGSVRIGKGGVFITRPFTYSGQHKVDLKL